MRQILALLTSALLTILSVEAYAQKNESENTYKLQKAYEALEEEADISKALDLVNEQLLETPDNVPALIFRIKLLRGYGDYARALRDVNHAIEVNKPEKTEIMMSILHLWKAYIYENMGDMENSVASFETAYYLARKDPKTLRQAIAFGHAQALYSLDDLNGLDALYGKMLEEDETDLVAMVGLARNMIKRSEYKAALEILDKCQSVDADYDEVYLLKMQAYDKLSETSKAIDAALD